MRISLPSVPAVCGAGAIVLITVAGAGCAQRALSMVRADANTHYFHGEYGQALPLNEEYVRRRPQNAQAQFELGRTLLALDEPAQARESLTIANTLEPDNDDYLGLLAEAMFRNGEFDALDQLLQRQIAERRRVEDCTRLGRFAQRMGNVDEAQRAFLNAAALDAGENPEPQRVLAEFYRSIGDSENEIRRLRMVLYFDPDDPAATERLRELGQVPGPSFAIHPNADG